MRWFSAPSIGQPSEIGLRPRYAGTAWEAKIKFWQRSVAGVHL